MNRPDQIVSTELDNNESTNNMDEISEQAQDEGPVKISNVHDPSIDEKNGSDEEDEKMKRTSKVMKHLTMLLVFVVLFALSAGGIWGMELFDKYLKQIPIEEVLPGDAEAVLIINLDPDAQQYQKLDQHFKKFPGYEKVMKEFDEVGEGKTLSQFIQDQLREKGIDFQQDIKPALGQTGYVLLPNLEPLESEFHKKYSWIWDGARVLTKEQLAFGGELEKIALGEESQDTRVLGQTSDYFARTASSGDQQPVDFILAAEVKDLSEAKDVIAKIKGNTSEYEVSDKQHQSYQYYHVSRTKPVDNGGLFCIKDTFHTMVGQNWVMATMEDDIKRIIENRKREHAMTKIIPFSKVEASTSEPLSENKKFQSVLEDLRQQDDDQTNLIFAYYILDFDKLLGTGKNDDGQNAGYQGFIKYSDQLTGGFLAKVQDEGIAVRSVSNQFSLEDAENVPFGSGLAGELPYQLDSRWADVFFEYDNVKSMYYGFKRNNLTDEGLKKWNELNSQIRQSLGIDFERDLIDQLSGALALTVYTAKGLEPEGVIVADVENQERVINTVEKLIELGKQTYLQMNPYAACFDPNVPQELKGMSFCDQLQLDNAQEKAMKKQIEEISNSSLNQAETAAGKIYSYKIPGTSLSFDFAFKDKKVVFGSHYAIVETVLKELGADPEASIAKSKEFQQVSAKVYPEGYSKVCVNTLGLWNAVEYYANQYFFDQSQDDKEVISAVGTIVKTINLFGGADAVSKQRQDSMSSLWLGINERPLAEKQKAQQFIDAHW